MLPLSLSILLQPTLTELGRLPARANLTPFPDETALRSGRTPWRFELHDGWRFQLIPNPDAAPRDWVTADTTLSDWCDIQVPGVWTRQGVGDLPHYANWQMPFDCAKPPQVPEQNPTGLYRTAFTPPEDWQDRQTILHLGGFESLALVWCNGDFIGMGKDSRLPSEFDLTPALQPGENQLAIMVLRWCDATWIEDQDHWNHGGLHRDVFLESRGATHVRDLVIDTDYDPEAQSGTAAITVEIAGPSAGWTARARLIDEAGQICAIGPDTAIEQFDTAAPTGAQWAQSYSFQSYAARFELNVVNAEAWSAEQPSRYRLVTELCDVDGQVQEVHETWVGFTRVETSGRRLRINGKQVVLIGVNRHDHHPENGKTCSADDIRAELVTMKRHNINAIRTAHYPNDPVLLDLADELGFYVIDEANVECHARWTEVSHHPGYQHAIIERVTRMIARDRNHPSVIGWSLGNEAGHSPAHDAAAAAARHLDTGRFVHYEGAVSHRLSFPFGRSPESTQQAADARELAATDVVCPMYPPIDHIVEWARWAEASGLDDRPMILCEFSHAMGNSNGSIAAYVDAFFAEPALAGGFVWDWRDQGLAETDEDGNFYWAYGGHFGDQPNDANFNINGLVGPDGVPHPALREYQWAARPFVSRLVADGSVSIENRHSFLESSGFELRYELLRDGEPVESGVLSPQIAASERLQLPPFLSAKPSPDAEWHLTLSWHLSSANDWAEAGHCVAWDQLLLASRPVEHTHFSDPRGTLAQPHDALTLQHDEMLLEFDQDGLIGGMSAGCEKVILTHVTPCLWRAPTDNDGGKPGARPLFQNHTAKWVGYGLNDLRPGAFSAEAWSTLSGLIKRFERVWHGADNEKLSHRTLVHFPDDKIVFDELLIIPEAWQDLPRIGVRFEVASEYDQLKWFGHGPDESYPDRKGAQIVGVWRSTVADQYHPYVRPQEHGAHEETRWFRLLNAAGEGIQITLPKPLSFSARRHHDVDLNDAETLAELKKGRTTEVHLDAAVRGLGTAACGPDTLAPYRVGPGTYQFRWELSFVEGEA